MNCGNWIIINSNSNNSNGKRPQQTTMRFIERILRQLFPFSLRFFFVYKFYHYLLARIIHFLVVLYSDLVFFSSSLYSISPSSSFPSSSSWFRVSSPFIFRLHSFLAYITSIAMNRKNSGAKNITKS